MYKIFHSPGEIIHRGGGFGTQYLDQLREDEKWVYAVELRRYLRSTYNLTIGEYYNLVVYDDKDKKHYCRICGKELPFYKLTKPYRQMCSMKCKGEREKELRAENPEYYHEINMKWQAGGSAAVKKMFNEGTHPFQTAEVHARSRLTNFIHNAEWNYKDDHATIYWAKPKGRFDVFKIGITTSEKVDKHLFRDKYRAAYPIISGTLVEISNIEYLLKVMHEKRDEYYPINKFREVINFIKSSVVHG